MNRNQRVEIIKKDFQENSKILYAICDEVRQKILLVLLDTPKEQGTRVEEIATKINLSRPAVSHHLKILKDEEIISVRKDGTKNYYYISGCTKILKLKSLLSNIDDLYQKIKKEEIYMKNRRKKWIIFMKL